MAVRSWGLVGRLGQRSSVELWSARKSLGRLGLPCGSSKRSYSWKSPVAEDFNVDVEAEGNAPGNRIEQALKEIRIQSAAPDWLPFFPGGSFWIHPDQIAAKKPEVPSGPMLDPATDREILAMVMPMGWPTSTAADDAMNPESDASK